MFKSTHILHYNQFIRNIFPNHRLYTIIPVV